jgi:cystathionine beta-lyase/cystathionine gamma-synthase
LQSCSDNRIGIPSPTLSAVDLLSLADSEKAASAASKEAERSVKSYRPATQVVYIEPSLGVKDPYNASSMPIYQTATFKQNSASEMGEYDYSRSGNPSRTHVGKQK